MTSESFIPFNRPSLSEADERAVLAALRSGHLSGDGGYSRRCHEFLERFFGVRKALLTTSCTHALEMAALLLDLRPGDEVIVPSFTFVSTVNAFVLRGATPVFADSRRDTLNMDENHVRSLVTPRTRAVFCVHYAGVGCEMDALVALCRRHGVALVEDNAHGLFGRYRGQWLGTFGEFATQSFHETKNFTSGEGGALLVNRDSHVERAEILREKGTDRSRFFRGQVDKYTWVDVGSSYLPSDALAALLLGQLERWQEIQDLRRGIWERYRDGLTDWARAGGVQLPFVPPECEQAYHMFYVVLPSLGVRQALIAHLKSRGIGSAFHYQPLDRSPMGERLAGAGTTCPVSARLGDCLLRLPFFNSLGAVDQARVIEAVREFRA